jgi:hypothetical protein
VSPRDTDFYVTPDGARLPRVTAILKAAYPFANLNWSAYLARDNTRRFARQVYDLVHPLPGVCLGLDGPSFDREVAATQGNAPPHELGQDAAEVGTAVHKYAEAVMRTRMGQNVRIPVLPAQEIVANSVVTSRHSNAVDAFHAWLDAHSVRPASTETRLISRVHGYAGTCDLLACVDDVFTVVDFKTSRGVFIEYLLQLSAYTEAAVEMGLAVPPVQAMVVRFPKEAGDTFEVTTFPWELQRERLFPLFLNAIEQWKYRLWFAENYPYRRRPA